MTITARVILLWAALICFALVALEFTPRRGSLLGLGLACWVGSQLVP